MQQGSVSIVVPTSGTGRYLWECLDRIGEVAGDLGVREVLVVVNGPENRLNHDSYRALLAGLDPTVAEKFTIVHEPVPGLLAGRHRGALAASGDFLSFVDDDVLLGHGWSGAVRELCESGSLGNRIAGGPIKPDFRGTPPAWISELCVSGFDSARIISELSLVDKECRQPMEVSPFLIFGLNFTIGRDVLFSLGGFNPDLTPPELMRFRGNGESAIAEKLVALNLEAIFHPGLAVHHIIGTERLNWFYICGVWFRQGISEQFRIMRDGFPSGKLQLVARLKFSSRLSRLARRVAGLLKRRGVCEKSSRTIALEALCHTVGRLYLRLNYARDRRVREWISKADYIDYRYPI